MNWKVVFLLLFVVGLCGCLVGGQIVYEKQQQQNQVTVKALGIAENQADSIGDLADAIKIQAEGNKRAIDELGDTVDYQRSDLAMTKIWIFLLAVVICVLFTVLIARGGKKEARREQDHS